jgi:hypothetical protein
VAYVPPKEADPTAVVTDDQELVEADQDQEMLTQSQGEQVEAEASI